LTAKWRELEEGKADSYVDKENMLKWYRKALEKYAT
jgi:hypothetical protein